MIRKHKKYKRPRKKYDNVRIDQENELVKRYGLKNKREIWKADAKVKRIRKQAKELITSSPEKQEEFLGRLNAKGFSVKIIADALALNQEDILKRRLQSVVFSRKLSNGIKQARQLIIHKHIAIDKNVVNIPSYHVHSVEEKLISVNINLVKRSVKND